MVGLPFITHAELPCNPRRYLRHCRYARGGTFWRVKSGWGLTNLGSGRISAERGWQGFGAAFLTFTPGVQMACRVAL